LKYKLETTASAASYLARRRRVVEARNPLPRFLYDIVDVCARVLVINLGESRTVEDGDWTPETVGAVIGRTGRVLSAINARWTRSGLQSPSQHAAAFSDGHAPHDADRLAWTRA
jgi:hypothetical protein